MAKTTQKVSRSERSLFRTVIVPLLLLLAVEIILLVGSLQTSGVVQRLDANARDIVDKQVENRQGYLENAMIGSWSDLTLLSQTINNTTQNLLDRGVISLEELDSSSDACAPLLLDVVDDMISTLYAKRMSGVFLIFNTQALDTPHRSDVEKTGIYIRDMDPNSTPSTRNADLLLERAPIAVVRNLNISTDSGWSPLFNFSASQEDGVYDYFYRPYNTAVQAQSVETPSDFGYWSKTPFTLKGSTQSSISYSIPLVLRDGTVYGVLGVDLLTDYLRTYLPYQELSDEKQGSFMLAVADTDEQGYTVNLVSGAVRQHVSPGDKLDLSDSGEGRTVLALDGRTYYASVQPFALYSSNTPSEQEQWVLIGVVPEKQLYAFSSQVRGYLYIAIICTLLTGVLGSLFISRRIARPIHQLSNEVAQAHRKNREIPQLTPTGIKEIDHFSQVFTSLSQDVLDSSTKFLRIMEMASVEIGGFELRQGDNRAFVTDNYFPLFGIEGVDPATLTAQLFQEKMQEINDTVEHSQTQGNDLLYCVRLPQGEVRYLRAETTQEADRYVGLVEDVTVATKERLRIEHERDCDLLTGLYSRRAFYRQAEELFSKPEQLGCAALVMLDLDNLKITNDRFGHDWGDQYIRQAGQCFSAATPANTLCARISGDEFCLLLYGYDSQDRIRSALNFLSAAIFNSVFDLPNGEKSRISASGGVAWYPESAKQFTELMKYADFAMYQVKHSNKGQLGEFNRSVFDQEHSLVQRRREFFRLLDKQMLSYSFQPIVDGRTGQPAAYEALMRPSLPRLSSPEMVLQIARNEGRLQDIERLTWNKSLEAFQDLLNRNLVVADALLFVNTIANQRIPLVEQQRLQQRYIHLKSRLVIEITETDELDLEILEEKRAMMGSSCMFALDDYGSGYNSEKNLLLLSPKFIKIDISIIRGVDVDVNKQQIVANIVRYAHERDMQVVGEGLETLQEVHKVLELGVDLLQGYCLARPGAIPPQVEETVKELIRQFWKDRSHQETK